MEGFLCPNRKIGIVTIRYAHFAEIRDTLKKEYEQIGIKLMFKKHFIHIASEVSVRGFRCISLIEGHDAHLLYYREPSLIHLEAIYGCGSCKLCKQQENYEILMKEQIRYDPMNSYLFSNAKNKLS